MDFTDYDDFAWAATGGIGRMLVHKAQEKGHTITCMRAGKEEYGDRYLTFNFHRSGYPPLSVHPLSVHLNLDFEEAGLEVAGSIHHDRAHIFHRILSISLVQMDPHIMRFSETEADVRQAIDAIIHQLDGLSTTIWNPAWV